MNQTNLALFLIAMFAVSCWLSWYSLGLKDEEIFGKRDENPPAADVNANTSPKTKKSAGPKNSKKSKKSKKKKKKN